MKILLLCEGDAEKHDAFSGITKSLLDHLRAAGHRVRVGDVELYGSERLLAAAAAFSPARDRWRMKFRLGPMGFRHRSLKARQQISRDRAGTDLILQIGATFAPLGRGRIPYALYCDSNFRMAEHGTATGFTWAVPLKPAERSAVMDRERLVYAHAGAICTISERLRQSFVEDFGIESERVHAVHAGPNLTPVPEERPQRDSHRRLPTVLFVGGDWERKGGDVLIAAMRQVRERVAQARLVIAGPRQFSLQEPWIDYLGYLDKNTEDGQRALRAAYLSAHVFCLPTRFEPFGIVFLEAMYFGLPCVGTDAWAVPEMIADGETGYLVPLDDPAILADRLVRVLSNPQEGQAMGAAGEKRARAYFTWPATVERIIRAVEPLLDERVEVG